ncbi:Cell fate regulator YaaT, PSP1 superfamily (controls sporulation, competence, biofilm development) [Balnearium lithotrophicum]|uniref:Cell fate regulator YaaT, PSP1 superfamily (Controls sporulation, competence, biofilm development) n=1 Tax=Balnearium lithotrophicum TaxID=223788 RepID=A0A521CV83_9BACT|nr:stage 0 sporulation family protein [Balnearium lithotrophicum]SMO63332.1 Cell fate regulator YaaT, PSP1 superfamily (controls sporulation, competence, biofilm development) [Balnearium lithotrophicum]
MVVLKFKYPDTEKVGLAKSDEKFDYGTDVVVKTDRGEELVKVLRSYKVDESTLSKFNLSEKELYSFLRLPTEEDRNRFVENLFFSKEALDVCREKVEKHGLNMKLVKAYSTLNRERIVFYFTAESRVDFRQLVRDLASHFKTRIELRQIGVRDEVKMVGGLGMCGRICCCKEFLDCFHSISLNMAKLQGLPPNPAKLSGTCGRLMCCLKYEEANYYIRQFLPEVGSEITTPDGNRGRVVDVNIVLETVTVEVGERGKINYPMRAFVSKEQWNSYIEMLKVKEDDRFKCFTKAGVIGDESN